MIVRLSQREALWAGEVGVTRHIQQMQVASKKGDKQGDGWGEDIEGAAGELAFCKALNLLWPGGQNAGTGPDVLTCQIKTTPLPHGSLIVRDTEADDEYCVLVIGKIPVYDLVGWLAARDARQECYLRNPPNSDGTQKAAWFVPQRDLRPIEELAVLLGCFNAA